MYTNKKGQLIFIWIQNKKNKNYNSNKKAKDEIRKCTSYQVSLISDLFRPTWDPADGNQRTGDTNHQSTSWLTSRGPAPRLAGRSQQRLWDHEVTITTLQYSLIKRTTLNLCMIWQLIPRADKGCRRVWKGAGEARRAEITAWWAEMPGVNNWYTAGVTW